MAFRVPPFIIFLDFIKNSPQEQIQQPTEISLIYHKYTDYYYYYKYLTNKILFSFPLSE